MKIKEGCGAHNHKADGEHRRAYKARASADSSIESLRSTRDFSEDCHTDVSSGAGIQPMSAAMK